MQYEPTYRKIYVASSWRNPWVDTVIEGLKADLHEVYNFKDPTGAFKWADIDADWKSWNVEQYKTALAHPEAARGFNRDFDALKWCDTCVLVIPCGASAHLELGWCCGMHKQRYILIPEGTSGLWEPELMYRMVGIQNIVSGISNLRQRLEP